MSPGIRSYLLGTQSDDRLVGLVRGGSEPAFEALVHRYRRPLLRYCRRLCLSEARAEEVLQQALMNAWVALRRDAEVRDVRAWLYRIAHNAAVNSIRREGAALGEAPPVDLDARRATAGTPAVCAASLDDVLALRDAFTGIAALPRMQREVIVRTAVGGHSHDEVASALGISDGAVRGLLHRARSTLRAGLTAVTPTPLLTWAAGGPSPVAGERITELVAGGGAAGLGGIAAKGGVLALTAGMAVAGSVIASHHGRPARRHAPPASAQGQLFSAAAGGLSAAGGATDSTAARGPRGGGTNDRLGQDGHRDGGSTGDRTSLRASGDGTSSGGDRQGTSQDGGSSSTSSGDSSTQVGSSSSDGGGLSSDGGLGSQSGDGGLTTQESQLQTSSSDGGESIQPSTSGGSGGGDLSSGSTDGGASKDGSSGSSTTTTTTESTSTG
jgi:RNA polymerase sigma factor (sigma-70 family)